MLCNSMQLYAMLCYAMQFYAMECNAILCNAMECCSLGSLQEPPHPNEPTERSKGTQGLCLSIRSIVAIWAQAFPGLDLP